MFKNAQTNIYRNETLQTGNNHANRRIKKDPKYGTMIQKGTNQAGHRVNASFDAGPRTNAKRKGAFDVIKTISTVRCDEWAESSLDIL